MNAPKFAVAVVTALLSGLIASALMEHKLFFHGLAAMAIGGYACFLTLGQKES